MDFYCKTEQHVNDTDSITNIKALSMPNLKAIADDKLTCYQTTNFRPFQTEKVCRRQFQI